jgi:putative membrane-bound dehydrogenase-like protein
MKTPFALVLALVFGPGALAWSQNPPQGPFLDEKSGQVLVPRRQAGPPGPPMPAEEAARKMTVPEGFTVEVVAAEPDLMNPVAMAIDDQGRFWVTESFEYPRLEPGPGKDRIKVLEDTDRDGRVDKVTVFAEGLNIPSGIAVGHGGVWVANAPDLLFLQDTDGDLKADSRKVVLTGFGRTDTHELPNSLTWGPDGYLYGLNGVFNYCTIQHRGRKIPMTCAMWRLNPVADAEGEWKGTHDFELFAEGTSNPWGIAWNENGDAFLSACVIDHLWHLSETGYYHRQGGPYPPHTWKLESIVKHQHQMAAYCGITWFDSDAYPEEYREKLYMGNIHGGCINADALERRGSSYFATPRADFVTANDVWHMPVAQQTGPDGCLYILDWYDRYHCYQDANADPGGVDRARGRLYRVRYRDTPRAPAFDLAKEADEKLVGRLGSPNVYYRERAQRLISERLITPGNAEAKRLRDQTEAVVLDEAKPRKARMHALWALIGSQRLDEDFHLTLLSHAEPRFRAWGVRAAGNADAVAEPVRKRIAAMAGDDSPDVLLQVAVAAGKVEGLEAPALLAEVLAKCGNDAVIPHIVWQNLYPRLGDEAAVEGLLSRFATDLPPGFVAMTPVLGEYLLTGEQPRLAAFTRLFEQTRHTAAAGELLANLSRRVRNREIRTEAVAAVRPQLEKAIAPLMAGESGDALKFSAANLAATWGQAEAAALVTGTLMDSRASEATRIAAAEAVAAAGGDQAIKSLGAVLADGAAPLPLRRAVLSSLGRLEAPAVASATLAVYAKLPAPLQRDAIELLTQRPAWSRELIAAVEAGHVAAGAVNPMQVAKMAASNANASLRPTIEKQWGKVRTVRNPQREELIARFVALAGEKTGDWKNGKAVFTRACSACHKLHGEGNVIGPDITVSGRGTLEQLLSNVLDPNLVIGESYQARIVNTKDGRAVMGLPVEDNDQRVVVRPPTGKDEIIARGDVKSVDVLPISLMPEGLEAAMTEQELLDLINYLAWDLHPEDPKATALSGVKLK